MGTVKRKTKNKIRRFIFDSVSFSLMCFGAYKMIEFGVLLSKIGVLALDFFPIFWFIMTVIGFIFFNVTPWLELINRIGRIEDLCRKLRFRLIDVLRKEESVQNFEKGQMTPFLMVLLKGVLYPLLLMYLTGAILSGFVEGSVLFICFLVVLSYLICSLISYRRMSMLKGMVKQCDGFVRYAERNLRRN